MDLMSLTIATAALLCSLVAGLLFGFAVVVMPGISKLRDRAFLRAFQEMDRVIQNNHPLFMLVWLGSAGALVLAALLSYFHRDGAEAWLVLAASALYLVGVQAPTIAINIPLNHRVQSLNLDEMDEQELDAARAHFEAKWTRWNVIRTVIATAASLLLIMAAIRL